MILYMHTCQTYTKSLTCSLTLQTGVSKKRLEKFLGGEDLESGIVRHDPSFSMFTVQHFHLFSHLVKFSFFLPVCCYMYSMYLLCVSICFHLLDSAVSICDGSFAWDKEAEPLLKKYFFCCCVKYNTQYYTYGYYAIWLQNCICHYCILQCWTYLFVCVVSVSLDIEPGRLVAVVGAVGSGKSSLMSALLGEMHSTKGFINIQVTPYFCLGSCLIKMICLARDI